MNEQIIAVAEELAREYFNLGDNFVVASFNANPRLVKLVFKNDVLIKITVELPYYLVEGALNEVVEEN